MKLLSKYELAQLRTDRGLFLDKGQHVFNVLHPDYDAKGDGVTDDTLAVQAAIDDCNANGGGVVYLPGHECQYVLGDVEVADAGVHVVGSVGASGATSTFGNRGTAINVKAGCNGLIYGNRENDVQFALGAKYMTFVGNATAKCGIRIGAVMEDPNNAVARLTFEGLRFRGFSGTGVTHTVGTGEPAAPVGAAGIFATRGVTVTFIDIYAWECAYGLLESANGTATTWNFFGGTSLRENTINGARFCTLIGGNFYGGVFESNGEQGFLVKPQANKVARNIHIWGGYAENNCGDAGTAQVEFLATESGAAILDCSVRKMDSNPSIANPNALGVYAAGEADVEVDGCIVSTEDIAHVGSDDTARVHCTYSINPDRTIGGFSLGRYSTLRNPGIKTGVTLTADEDDYDVGFADTVHLTATGAARTITGLDCTKRKLFRFVNVGSEDIVLSHDDAGSAAENRFVMASGADITLSQNDIADGFYDGASQRWRVTNVIS